MKKILLLPIFGILIFAMLPHNAYAMSYSLSSTSCATLGGSWNSSTSTCTIVNLTIHPTDKLIVNSGTTLRIIGVVNNSGIINSTGTINNTGTFINSGTITNSGIINNGDTLENTGTIIDSGTINNLTGTITNSGGSINISGILNNGSILNIKSFGTINITGIITSYKINVFCGSTLADSVSVIGGQINYLSCTIETTP